VFKSISARLHLFNLSLLYFYLGLGFWQIFGVVNKQAFKDG